MRPSAALIRIVTPDAAIGRDDWRVRYGDHHSSRGGTAMTASDDQRTSERFARLEARIEEQHLEIERQRRIIEAMEDRPAGRPETGDRGSGDDARRHDRRGALRHVGAVAAAAVVAGPVAAITSASPAAAAPGTFTGDPAVNATADEGGMAIQAHSATGDAIYGSTNTGIGVTGYSGELRGVYGSSPAGVGVMGYSTDDVAVYASSENGYGLRSAGGTAAAFLPGEGTAPQLRSDAHTAGELEATSADLWWCIASGTPGTWRKLAGPLTAGALHVLAAPVRVYDSRPNNPPDLGPKVPMTAGEERVVDTGFDAAVPDGATAVSINLTILSGSTTGFVSAFANGIDWPGTSSINWDRTNQITANSAIVAVDELARFRIRASDVTNVVVDVIGYYQ